MQNRGYGYSINPLGEKFVFTKGEVIELKETMGGVPIYEFYGVFKKDRIESTNQIVVKGGKVLLQRADFLKDKYGIDYHDVDTYDEITYIRYFIKTPVRNQMLSKFKQKITEVYGVDAEVSMGFPSKLASPTDFKYCNFGAFDYVVDKRWSTGGAGAINIMNVNVVNALDIREVATKVNCSGIFDDYLNIETSKGNVFCFVSEHYGSAELAMDFFNVEYQTAFVNPVDNNFINEGVQVGKKGDSIFEKSYAYYKYDDQGEIKKITDFIIRVHSTYINPAGEKKYTVSLVNEEGEESEHIIWENTANKNKLGDFVQKFGSYHFLGGGADVIKLHSLITNIKAPEVKNITGFGWHGDECIFPNGIWDNRKKEFFESTIDGTGVIKKRNGDGIIVIDPNGNRIDQMLSGKTSIMKTSQNKIDKDAFIEIIRSFWKDDTGMVIYLIACSILGSGMAGLNKDCPMYYFRGITQTGKTTMSEMLQRMVGFPFSGVETFEGTAFTTLMLLSSNYNLPVFFSEGRHAARQMKDKISALRSSYDKKGIPRGRADMSSVSFPLTAIAVMEGEEMLNDGAVRTRCIQFKPNAKAKLDGYVFKERIKKAYMLDYFMNSYFTEADISRYEEYLEAGLKMFSGITSGRNTHNMSHMYACAMCYYPELEEEIMPTISRLIQVQATDEEDNGTSVDIVKSVQAFIERKEYPIYYQMNGFVISWSSIQEYARKYRQELSLSISSYKEHLDALGYTVDFYEVEDSLGGQKMVEGALFPYKDIDKRLLCDTDIYAKYKTYQQRVI